MIPVDVTAYLTPGIWLMVVLLIASVLGILASRNWVRRHRR